MESVIQNLLRSIALIGMLVVGIPWILFLLIPLAAIPIVIGVAIMAHLIYSAFSKKQKEPENLKILVVDDDESSVISLLSILSSLSTDVHIVKSGIAMVKELAKHEYDVVFVDRMMPKQNGDIALMIADSMVSYKKAIPVIFFTGTEQHFKTPELAHFQVLGRWNKQMPYKMLELEVETLLKDIQENVA